MTLPFILYVVKYYIKIVSPLWQAALTKEVLLQEIAFFISQKNTWLQTNFNDIFYNIFKIKPKTVFRIFFQQSKDHQFQSPDTS